ncbi:hypothetical protein [Paraburkholderia sp. Ac-20347]|uniref:hypothetical protein n=1 Tax=Paraburkholderia sp. Ac-20347 TaxID=2703892 RepID=UPI001980C518|nr:hypothetical protein [Paraburkholderia sp. Ac-20347]MBN3808150.1 hypothetical protein [Paraburkholderia sp. Ac-20347]
MDQPVNLSIGQEKIAQVEKIVGQITTRKRKEPEKTALQVRLEKMARTVRDHAVFSAVTLAVLAGLSLLFRSETLGRVALAVAGIAGVLVMAANLLVIGGAVPFLNRRRKEPFATVLASMSEAIALDLPAVQQLLECERNATEYVLIHYRHRRRAFETRHALIAGPLEKIGLFPALAAFAIIAIKVWSVNNSWLHTIIFVIPAFYVLTFFDYEIVEEMDRTIALLEYSLALRDRLAIPAG